VTISLSIMAHPSRHNWVVDLCERTGCRPENVAWDRGEGLWDTARRAWGIYDPAATHHLVLQDDALPCRDLLAGVENALAHIPPAAPVSLYYGTPHPDARGVAGKRIAAEKANEWNASFIILPSLHWGLALMLPTSVIADMLRFCADGEGGDDERIGQYMRDVREERCWYTWPSLVEHGGRESLVGHGDTTAYNFVGTDASALDLAWDGPVVGSRHR
jgi:hypothetical protein